ncbi:hypothetical protein K8Z61_11210 [Nocardioides sp. TRM66260-LWL]|uniref:DUF6912 family protein n=1 Tax=Nocardioides sp. TRM66260-LWL TaxID=2874478 RepID=UPI001CC63C3B|nr:hypothetical protein [Nocardioides sp. TRM66260-LWL]MBZ5735067.1 hypothetical protein [Nocardioides sp. TRM66260-LWL]
MTRAYVPATYAELARFHAAGEVPTTEAVTASDTSEEAEYDALLDAAVASAERAAGSDDPRRVVLAVDVPTVGLAAPWRHVASVHVDVEPGAEADDDLAWYATQEVGDLLGLAD